MIIPQAPALNLAAAKTTDALVALKAIAVKTTDVSATLKAETPPAMKALVADGASLVRLPRALAANPAATALALSSRQSCAQTTKAVFLEQTTLNAQTIKAASPAQTPLPARRMLDHKTNVAVGSVFRPTKIVARGPMTRLQLAMTALTPADQTSLRWNSTGPSLLRGRIRVLTRGLIKVIVRRQNRAATTTTRLHRNHAATTGIHRLRVAMIATRRLREAHHLVTVHHHAQMAVHLHRTAEVEVREAVAVMNQGPLAPNSVSFVRQRKVSFLVGSEEQKRAIQIWIPFSDFLIEA